MQQTRLPVANSRILPKALPRLKVLPKALPRLKVLPKAVPRYVGPRTPEDFRNLIADEQMSQLGYKTETLLQVNCDIDYKNVRLPSCGYSAVLRVSGSGTDHIAVWLACKRWNCSKCGPVKKDEWTNSLTPYVSKVLHLEKLTVSFGGWDALKRRIQRAGGQFTRLRYEDNFLILTDARVGGFTIPKAIREAELAAVIKAMPYGVRAITSSRGWKKAVLPPTDQYDMVGTTARSIQEIDSVLRSNGIFTKEISIGSSKKPGISFNLPPVIAEKAYIHLLWSIGIGCITEKDREKFRAT